MVSQPVRIIVLVENTAASRSLLGEHGLVFRVEAGSKRVLFDTGQSIRPVVDEMCHVTCRRAMNNSHVN